MLGVQRGLILPQGSGQDLSGYLQNQPPLHVNLSTGKAYLGDYPGGNYTEVQLDGSLQAYGDAVYWDDDKYPATGINPPGAVSDPQVDPDDGGLLFEAGKDQRVVLMTQVSHRWKLGSSLHPHFHWEPMTSNVGTFCMQLDYKVAQINGQFPLAWTPLVANPTTPGDTRYHKLNEFGEIPMTGITSVSTMIKIRITRFSSTVPVGYTDTFTGDLKLLEFDYHFQIDTAGSRQEYVK